MFSLIITLIAIALVAALALATLYYGGPVFNEGSERALAAKLDAQGQQIMGALELYNAEMGHYPNTLDDLVSTNYLKAIPTAAAEQAVMAAAYAATAQWSLASPGQPVIVMKPVSLATCQAFNKTNIGTAGVLQRPHSTQLKQCIGTDVNNLMIVQPKAASDLIYVSNDPTAVVQIGSALSTALPPVSDTTLNGWLDTSSTGSPAPSGVATFSTQPLAFAATAVGATATDQSLVITNTGTGNLTFAAQSASASAPFTVNAAACNGVTLSPGQTCSVSVGFAPSVAGTFTGAAYQLTLLGANGALGSVSLTGTATAAPQVPSAVVLFNDTFTGTGSLNNHVSDSNHLYAASSTGNNEMLSGGALYASSQGWDLAQPLMALAAQPVSLETVLHVGSTSTNEDIVFNLFGRYDYSAQVYGGKLWVRVATYSITSFDVNAGDSVTLKWNYYPDTNEVYFYVNGQNTSWGRQNFAPTADSFGWYIDPVYGQPSTLGIDRITLTQLPTTTPTPAELDWLNNW